MSALIFLYLVSLPASLVLVWLSVRLRDIDRQHKMYLIANGMPYGDARLVDMWQNPLVGDVPRIEPPRAPEVTAHVRLVPHPTDYRKFIRVVEGVSDDPLEPAKPTTHGPMRGNH